MDINTMIKGQLKMTMAPRGVLLVVTLLAAQALSGCGDRNEQEFIRGCKSGGGTTAVCSCIWDELKTKYTHGELEKMNQQYGYVPPAFYGQHAERRSAVQKIRTEQNAASY